jgi:23S rRNA U2552 (ribose-2'-O)-methylase RlmE/FtsJ
MSPIPLSFTVLSVCCVVLCVSGYKNLLNESPIYREDAESHSEVFVRQVQNLFSIFYQLFSANIFLLLSNLLFSGVGVYILFSCFTTKKPLISHLTCTIPVTAGIYFLSQKHWIFNLFPSLLLALSIFIYYVRNQDPKSSTWITIQFSKITQWGFFEAIIILYQTVLKWISDKDGSSKFWSLFTHIQHYTFIRHTIQFYQQNRILINGLFWPIFTIWFFYTTWVNFVLISTLLFLTIFITCIERKHDPLRVFLYNYDNITIIPQFPNEIIGYNRKTRTIFCNNTHTNKFQQVVLTTHSISDITEVYHTHTSKVYPIHITPLRVPVIIPETDRANQYQWKVVNYSPQLNYVLYHVFYILGQGYPYRDLQSPFQFRRQKGRETYITTVTIDIKTTEYTDLEKRLLLNYANHELNSNHDVDCQGLIVSTTEYGIIRPFSAEEESNIQRIISPNHSESSSSSQNAYRPPHRRHRTRDDTFIKQRSDQINWRQSSTSLPTELTTRPIISDHSITVQQNIIQKIDLEESDTDNNLAEEEFLPLTPTVEDNNIDVHVILEHMQLDVPLSPIRSIGVNTEIDESIEIMIQPYIDENVQQKLGLMETEIQRLVIKDTEEIGVQTIFDHIDMIDESVQSESSDYSLNPIEESNISDYSSMFDEKFSRIETELKGYNQLNKQLFAALEFQNSIHNRSIEQRDIILTALGLQYQQSQEEFRKFRSELDVENPNSILTKINHKLFSHIEEYLAVETECFDQDRVDTLSIFMGELMSRVDTYNQFSMNQLELLHQRINQINLQFSNSIQINPYYPTIPTNIISPISQGDEITESLEVIVEEEPTEIEIGILYPEKELEIITEPIYIEYNTPIEIQVLYPEKELLEIITTTITSTPLPQREKRRGHDWKAKYGENWEEDVTGVWDEKPNEITPEIITEPNQINWAQEVENTPDLHPPPAFLSTQQSQSFMPDFVNNPTKPTRPIIEAIPTNSYVTIQSSTDESVYYIFNNSHQILSPILSRPFFYLDIPYDSILHYYFFHLSRTLKHPDTGNIYREYTNFSSDIHHIIEEICATNTLPNDVHYAILRDAVYHCFCQHPNEREELIKTVNHENNYFLVYSHPTNKCLGVITNPHSQEIANYENWNGMNNYGEVLMDVVEDLMNVEDVEDGGFEDEHANFSAFDTPSPSTKYAHSAASLDKIEEEEDSIDYANEYYEDQVNGDYNDQIRENSESSSYKSAENITEPTSYSTAAKMVPANRMVTLPDINARYHPLSPDRYELYTFNGRQLTLCELFQEAVNLELQNQLNYLPMEQYFQIIQIKEPRIHNLFTTFMTQILHQLYQTDNNFRSQVNRVINYNAIDSDIFPTEILETYRKVISSLNVRIQPTILGEYQLKDSKKSYVLSQSKMYPPWFQSDLVNVTAQDDEGYKHYSKYHRLFNEFWNKQGPNYVVQKDVYEKSKEMINSTEIKGLEILKYILDHDMMPTCRRLQHLDIGCNPGGITNMYHRHLNGYISTIGVSPIGTTASTKVKYLQPHPYLLNLENFSSINCTDAEFYANDNGKIYDIITVDVGVENGFEDFAEEQKHVSEALKYAKKRLTKDGYAVIKLQRAENHVQNILDAYLNFSQLHIIKPSASRRTNTEAYIIVQDPIPCLPPNSERKNAIYYQLGELIRFVTNQLEDQHAYNFPIPNTLKNYVQGWLMVYGYYPGQAGYAHFKIGCEINGKPCESYTIGLSAGQEIWIPFNHPVNINGKPHIFQTSQMLTCTNNTTLIQFFPNLDIEQQVKFITDKNPNPYVLHYNRPLYCVDREDLEEENFQLYIYNGDVKEVYYHTNRDYHSIELHQVYHNQFAVRKEIYEDYQTEFDGFLSRYPGTIAKFFIDTRNNETVEWRSYTFNNLNTVMQFCKLCNNLRVSYRRLSPQFNSQIQSGRQYTYYREISAEDIKQFPSSFSGHIAITRGDEVIYILPCKNMTPREITNKSQNLKQRVYFMYQNKQNVSSRRA